MGKEVENSRRSRIIRELVAEFNHNDFLRTKFREEKRGLSEFDKPYKYPVDYKAEKIHMPNFDMELLSLADNENEWVLLQLHGGGYVGPMKNSYRNFARMYCDYGKGMKVLTIDYRVAPDNPYPAAVEDALCAFDWLREQGYSEDRIILAGDSAGGGLAMALCHYLKDNNRKLPAAIIAMSPWTDLTGSGESYEANYSIDPIFGNTHESLIYDNPYPGDVDTKNPYISPLFGDFSGFPPMLIQVGSHEMLLSDSVDAADKAKNAGVKVKLSVYEGMFHVFQMAGRLMPESLKAWGEIGHFLRVITKLPDDDVEEVNENEQDEPDNGSKLRLALVQTNIVWEDKEANLQALENTLNLLQDKRVDIVLLPEMSFTGFSMNTAQTAETDNHTLDVCGRLAALYDVAIGVGWVKKVETGMSENHYSIIMPIDKAGENLRNNEDGKTENQNNTKIVKLFENKDYLIASDYVKIHPFSYAGEDKFFKGGETLYTCSLGDFTVGTAICYDLRFPELFQALSKKADLIVVPANWPASRSKHWKTLLMARAIENQSYIAGINCCGDMNGQLYSGDSCLVSPEGELVKPCEYIRANASDSIFLYEIEYNIEQIREGFPVKRDRRESLYGKICVDGK